MRGWVTAENYDVYVSAAHNDRNIQYAVFYQLAARLSFPFLSASTFYQLSGECCHSS